MGITFFVVGQTMNSECGCNLGRQRKRRLGSHQQADIDTLSLFVIADVAT